ncbi:S1C family serine protease [Anaerovorax odorimutans]|uniref:S1C family serine protease n=1 Tax=Anaerovorax odorimutans TaxID=109327 RepID=UPI0003F5AED2|nr:trypsin-like peptidase domain-containing protein [Anaerovorax odorimutans]
MDNEKLEKQDNIYKEVNSEENIDFEREIFVENKAPKRNRNGNKVLAIVLIVFLSLASGFGGGIAAMYFGQNILGNNTSNTITIKPESNINTAEVVAKKVIPSVVGISTESEITFQSIFGQQTQKTTGVGTGIIVDKEGYILTNSHVVNDGSTKTITVQLADGRDVKGEVLWNDASIDLAIVKIKANNLVAAELGDSEEVNVGSYTVAIGNPLGMAFQRSVTQGVVSGLNRSISISDGQGSTTIDDLIQTDASINSGNSGGPLLNSEGQVIGINTAKAQSAEGLGFAIPINTAKPIVEEIITKGEFNRAYIGIKGISVEDLVKAYPNEDFGAEKGVYVVQIYTESPAAKAGLKEDDVIIGINDKEVETMSQLIKDLYQYRPGDKITLKVLRNSKKINLDVTLTETVE